MKKHAKNRLSLLLLPLLPLFILLMTGCDSPEKKPEPFVFDPLDLLRGESLEDLSILGVRPGDRIQEVLAEHPDLKLSPDSADAGNGFITYELSFREGISWSVMHLQGRILLVALRWERPHYIRLKDQYGTEYPVLNRLKNRFGLGTNQGKPTLQKLVKVKGRPGLPLQYEWVTNDHHLTLTSVMPGFPTGTEAPPDSRVPIHQYIILSGPTEPALRGAN